MGQCYRHDAHKVLLNIVNPTFSISTSCLYTYTKNYKKGTIQAKLHQHGKEENANVSLQKASDTSEKVNPLGFSPCELRC